MKILKWVSVPFFTLLVVYGVGPRPETPEFSVDLPKVSTNLAELEAKIQENEQNVPHLKPDNQARIVWYDSTNKEVSPFSLVYIHGFSASQEEGAPIHREFAQRYGCNLYLARLPGHGIDDPEVFKDLTPEQLLESAQEAIAIGKQIGKKVIVMSTSTGATLALYTAAFQKDITGLIIYSPLIDFYSSSTWLLDKPWGLQIARQVFGGDYFYQPDRPELFKKYWTYHYRLEGLVALKTLVANTMEEATFEKVKQPLFLGYYYKDEAHQDETVSVPHMLEMYEQLGTPDSLKRKQAFPDVGDHVIASHVKSKDLESVRMATYQFVEEVLDLKPVR